MSRANSGNPSTKKLKASMGSFMGWFIELFTYRVPAPVRIKSNRRTRR